MRLLSRFEHRGPRLVGAGLLLQARDRLLKSLHVGEDQLGVDRLHVFLRRHATLDMHDIVVGEGAQYLADGIGFANVGEELVAESRALAGALDDAGDINERHCGGNDLFRAKDPCEYVKTGIRHSHHARVRLDGGERVVGREHVVLRQGVEHRGLADVREADDADCESHGLRILSERRRAAHVGTRSMGWRNNVDLGPWGQRRRWSVRCCRTVLLIPVI